MKKLLIYILLLVSVTSCVSTRTAKNIDKAENRIKKYNTGITNQIDRFPSLVDEAFTTIKYDTIKIPADTVTLGVELFDVKSLDSLEQEYYNSQDALDRVKFSLRSLEDSNPRIVRELQNAQNLLNEYKIKNDSIFSLYRQASRHTQFLGTYNDDRFKIRYTVFNGNLELDIKTNSQYKVVKVSETTNKIKIKDKFYQDFWFWIFLAGLITVFYFFGDFINKALKEGIEKLIHLVTYLFKKLIP